MKKCNLSIEASELAKEIGVDNPDTISIIKKHLEDTYRSGCLTVLHHWPFNVASYYTYVVEKTLGEFPTLLYHESMIYAAIYLKNGQPNVAAKLCPTIPWIENEMEHNGLSESLIKRVYADIVIPYAELKITQYLRLQDNVVLNEEIKVCGSLSPEDFLNDYDNEYVRPVKIRLLLALIIQCLVDALIHCHRNNQESLTVDLIGGEKAKIIITPFNLLDEEYELISSYHFSELFSIETKNGRCVIRKLKR
jgi:hypothetical protein